MVEKSYILTRPAAAALSTTGAGRSSGIILKYWIARRGRAAELERTTASGEPDRHAMAMKDKAAMKGTVLVRLAVSPQTGAVDQERLCRNRAAPARAEGFRAPPPFARTSVDL
jgi:hypothetical protein